MGKLVFLLTVLMFVPGCLDNKPRQEAPISTDSAPPAPKSNLSETLKPLFDQQGRSISSRVEELKSETQNSSNVTQNAIQGLGVSVSKVAEKVQGFGGDLLRFRAEIKTDITNSLDVNQKITLDKVAEIRTDMSVQAQSEIRALNGLRSEIDAKIDALAQAQIGLSNHLKQNTEMMEIQTKAGRDSFTMHTQFTREMVDTIRSGNRTIFWTTIGITFFFSMLICVGMLILLERSRQRAEERFRTIVNGRPLTDEKKQ